MLLNYLRQVCSTLLLSLWATLAWAQITVQGRVTDDAGTGLPGVSISLKGTSRGTTTERNGTYSLPNVNRQDELVFSFIGYVS